MSQASKQVDWCLKKAQREIEECERLGKQPKHRGLLKVEPNQEDAREHIERAEYKLRETEYLIKGNFLDSSIGTIFYSMYRCFLAIASKFGYESGNQTCTVSLIEYLKEQEKINLDSKFIKMFKYSDGENKDKSVIELREDYTYSTKHLLDKEKIDELILLARELIDQTRQIVFE